MCSMFKTDWGGARDDGDGPRREECRTACWGPRAQDARRQCGVGRKSGDPPIRRPTSSGAGLLIGRGGEPITRPNAEFWVIGAPGP